MIIYPRSTGQKKSLSAQILHQPPNIIIIQEILNTESVVMVLYIQIDTNVIGMKVAVKIIPHMLTSTTDTLYARAR